MANDIEETRKEVNRDAAGAYGGDVDKDLAKQSLGDDATTEPLRENSQAKKEPPATTGTNPKRTENSRPD